MGPVEVLVVGFPGNRFNGAIIPEIQSLVDRGLIAVVDGVLVRKDGQGDVTFAEFAQEDADEDVARLAALFGEMQDLITEEDVVELAAGLEPDSSAAMLVFEHRWAAPLKQAITDSGGVLVADFRVPGRVVDEVLAGATEA